MFRLQWLRAIGDIPLPHVLKEIIVAFIGNSWMVSHREEYKIDKVAIGVVDGEVYSNWDDQTYCNDTCIFSYFQALVIQKIRGNWLLVLLSRFNWSHAGFYIYNKQTKDLHYHACFHIGCIKVYQGNVYYILHDRLWQFDPETKVATRIPKLKGVSSMESYGDDLLLSFYSDRQRLFSNNQLLKDKCVWVHDDRTIIYERYIEHDNKRYPVSFVISHVLSHGPICIIYGDRLCVWDSRTHELIQMDEASSSECFFKDDDDLYRCALETVDKLVFE